MYSWGVFYLVCGRPLAENAVQPLEPEEKKSEEIKEKKSRENDVKKNKDRDKYATRRLVYISINVFLKVLRRRTMEKF